jgi:hypothetical protein
MNAARERAESSADAGEVRQPGANRRYRRLLRPVT